MYRTAVCINTNGIPTSAIAASCNAGMLEAAEATAIAFRQFFRTIPSAFLPLGVENGQADLAQRCRHLLSNGPLGRAETEPIVSKTEILTQESVWRLKFGT